MSRPRDAAACGRRGPGWWRPRGRECPCLPKNRPPLRRPPSLKQRQHWCRKPETSRMLPPPARPRARGPIDCGSRRSSSSGILSTSATTSAQNLRETLPLPFTLAAIQLLVGVPYVWMLWLTGMRKAPELSISKVKGTTPVAMAHTMAHLAAVISIGAGAVGFVQIVKGAEPLFTSGLSFLAGSAMPWQVYTTLLPVVGGVAMASAGEVSFSALAFGAAMTSNASAASRSVLGKIFMAKEKENGGAMCAGNLYAVMTMLGCLVLTPAALWVEGPRVASVWNAALSAGHSQRSLVKNVLLSGVFFYLYNEVSFYALNIIHPVTHALGNTLKRVVMIIVSVLVLNHRFTPLGLAGCTTAIGGVMAYSLTKARLEQAGVVVPVGKVAAVKAQLENEAGVSVPVGKAAEVAVAVVAAAKNKKEGATGEEDGGTAAEKGG
ncbi:unnamed protein product [Ectocarpus sp. 4 AP-2014]